MDNITPSICVFLDGEPGAAEVLNDALELVGLERVAKDGNPAERLELVLTHLMPRPQAELLACEFAEHVMPIAKKKSSNPKDLKKILKSKRSYLAGKVEFDVMRKLAASALQGWTADNSPDSFALWAQWAAALAAPKDTAKSAQRVASTELEWQIERTKQFLKESHDR
jgi:hypothetical protein